MVHDDGRRGCSQQPWGPEAHRRRLAAGIETAVVAILRSAAASLAPCRARSPLQTPASASASAAMAKASWVLGGSSRSVQRSEEVGAATAIKPASDTQSRESTHCDGDAQRIVSQLVCLLYGRDRQCSGSLWQRGARLSARPLSRAKTLRLRRLVALLDSVHGLLTSGRYATPRELFYTHVAIFSRQQQCDDLLKKLCVALEVPRHYLHLVGTARGLVRGHLRIFEPSIGVASAAGSGGIWIDGMDPLQPRGHTIAPICAHIVQVESVARTVLVVEKETVFHRLLDEGVLEQQKPLILVTARGNPDIPTRYFLRRLFEDCAAPRILLLVDADAFGLSIAFTYAFGPERTEWIQDDLALPDAELVGCVGLPPADAQARFGLGRDDVAPLTPRDVAVIHGVQRRLAALRLSGTEPPRLEVWERAAARLLNGGLKYELDALDHLSELVARSLRRSRGGGGGSGDGGGSDGGGVMTHIVVQHSSQG